MKPIQFNSIRSRKPPRPPCPPHGGYFGRRQAQGPTSLFHCSIDPLFQVTCSMFHCSTVPSTILRSIQRSMDPLSRWSIHGCQSERQNLKQARGPAKGFPFPAAFARRRGRRSRRGGRPRPFFSAARKRGGLRDPRNEKKPASSGGLSAWEGERAEHLYVRVGGKISPASSSLLFYHNFFNLKIKFKKLPFSSSSSFSFSFPFPFPFPFPFHGRRRKSA